jgi:hypothetical protein
LSDNIKRGKGNFDPINETRTWQVAASEYNCQRLAKNSGKRLIEVIYTDDKILPVVCIFEDEKNE